MLFLIWFPLYLIGLLLCMYAYNGSFPSIETDLRMPSLKDLSIPEDDVLAEYRKDDYVKDKICPAYHYFVLHDELKHAYSKRAGELVSYLIVFCFPLGCFARGLKALGLISPNFLVWVITLFVWIAGYLLARFIYSRFCELKQFRYTNQDFAADSLLFQNLETKYCETKEAACNNYIIHLHLQYLLSVQKSIRFRLAVARILSVLFGAIYLLFFFSIEA